MEDVNIIFWKFICGIIMSWSGRIGSLFCLWSAGLVG